MRCCGCSNAVRAGCSYDVASLHCLVKNEPVGFYDDCDVSERQKLVWLLNGKSIDTPSDVEYVADYLLSNGICVL